MLLDVFVCLVDPTHGIFDGLRTVDSCTKTECIEGRRPSIHRSIRRSCRRTRVRRSARAHRALVRPRVRRARRWIDRYIFDASGFVVGVRVRRSRRSRRTHERMVGWMGKTTRALDGRRGATLRARIDSLLFFWRVVNRGFVRGSTHTQTTPRVVVLVLRVRVRANARDGWRDGWMKWG